MNKEICHNWGFGDAQISAALFYKLTGTSRLKYFSNRSAIFTKTNLLMREGAMPHFPYLLGQNFQIFSKQLRPQRNTRTN